MSSAGPSSRTRASISAAQQLQLPSDGPDRDENRNGTVTPSVHVRSRRASRRLRRRRSAHFDDASHSTDTPPSSGPATAASPSTPLPAALSTPASLSTANHQISSTSSRDSARLTRQHHLRGDDEDNVEDRDREKEKEVAIKRGRGEELDIERPSKRLRKTRGKDTALSRKIEAERRRLEKFYAEKSSFFASVDDYALSSASPPQSPRPRPLDLNALAGEVSEHADLGEILNTDKKRPMPRRQSARLQHPGSADPSDALPDAGRFFDTDIMSLASSNIEAEPTPLEIFHEVWENEETPPVQSGSTLALARQHSLGRGSSAAGSFSVGEAIGASRPPLSPLVRRWPAPPSRLRPPRPHASSLSLSGSLSQSGGLAPYPRLLHDAYQNYVAEYRRSGDDEAELWSIEQYYQLVYRLAGFHRKS